MFMGMWLHGLKVAARARIWAAGVGGGWVRALGEGVGGVAIDIYGYGSAAWASGVWLGAGMKKKT